MNFLASFCVLLACHASALSVTPTQQVVEMLQKMKSKGQVAMDMEKKTFAEYSQFVDDTVTATKQSITTGKAEVEKLTAFISQAESDIATMGREIGELDAEIAAQTADKKASIAQREEDRDEFLKNQADLAESVDALERAIQTLSAQDYDRSQAMMLLQTLAKKTQGMQRVLAALYQQQHQQEPGAPEVAAYEFQSSGVVDLLKSLLQKFKGELGDAEKAEMNSAHAYDLEQLHLDNFLTRNNADREDKAAARASRTSESKAAQGELAQTKADLAADEKLLQETQSIFATKTSNFEANQKVRQEELEALGKAIEILSSPEVQENYATHINFLQLSSQSLLLSGTGRAIAKTHAAAFLKARATALSSKLLAEAATSAAESPFAKVIEMIENLLAKLKEEAASEADHKAWCDEELKQNKLKREKKTSQVGVLSAEVDQFESSIASMAEDIKNLQADEAALVKAIAEATETRHKEKADNEATVKDAEEGAEAVKKAIIVLKEFYESQAALVQTKKQVPELAAYKGMQEGKDGVIGMLEVIESDFSRLLAETTANENSAASLYDSFIKEAEATKEMKHDAAFKLSLEKDQAEFDMGRTRDSLRLTQEELDKANQYYNELKPSCVVVHVSFEERVARRKEEIEALKEAYKILDQKSASA